MKPPRRVRSVEPYEGSSLKKLPIHPVTTIAASSGQEDEIPVDVHVVTIVRLASVRGQRYGNSPVSATATVGNRVGKYMTFVRHPPANTGKSCPEKQIELNRGENPPRKVNSMLPAGVLTNGSFGVGKTIVN